MKIGLYFGSFNPVHIGHLIIANYICTNTVLDQVWFVISPHNPLKKAESLLNENHRKSLIDLAIEGEKKLKTSNVEFKLPKPSYTIDTLTYLEEKYPQDQFIVIMGSDSFGNINRWKNSEILLRDFDIYIYERPGFEVKLPTGSRQQVVKAPLLEISSTQIRELLRRKKSIRFLVPDVVLQEIEHHQYYS
jgi:nicotinate-nucleotide adenylyltransferase